MKSTLKTKKSFGAGLRGRWHNTMAGARRLYRDDRWMFFSYGFLLVYGLFLLLAVSFPEDAVGMGDTITYLIFHPGRTLGFGVVLKFVALVFQNYAAVKIIQLPFFFWALWLLANRFAKLLAKLGHGKKYNWLVLLLVVLVAGNWDTQYLHYILLSDSIFCSFVILITAMLIDLWLAPRDVKSWQRVGWAIGASLLFRPAGLPFIMLLPIFYIMVFGWRYREGKKLLYPLLLYPLLIIVGFNLTQKIFDRWLNRQPQSLSASLLYGNANMLASVAHTNPFPAGSYFDRVWRFYENKYRDERALVDGLPARYCVTAAYQRLAVNYVIWGEQGWWGNGFLQADVFSDADRVRFLKPAREVKLDPYLDEPAQNQYTRAVFMANKWPALKLFACNYVNASFHGYDFLFAKDDHYQNVLTKVMATLIYNKEQSINHDYADFIAFYKKTLLAAAATHQLSFHDIVRFIGYRDTVLGNVLKMTGGENYEQLRKRNEFSPTERQHVAEAYDVAQALPNGNYTTATPTMLPWLTAARFGYTILWTLGFVLSWGYIGYFAVVFLRRLFGGELSARAARLLLPCLLAVAAQGYLLTLALVAVYEARYIQPMFPLMIMLLLLTPLLWRGDAAGGKKKPAKPIKKKNS
ncbi:MAG: hypothetical protein QM529_06525 [Hydrotalea sp.]|nr:hypothetical protein [Hydrotalea sp.]